MKLIDGDALKTRIIEYLEDLYKTRNYGTHEELYETDGEIRACEMIIEDIDEAQTIDAIPFRHGEWIPEHHGSIEVKCSLCGANDDIKAMYCWKCGAKMGRG